LICIAPRREHTSKALTCGTRSQEISQSYLHTPRLSANGMKHTCLSDSIFQCQLGLPVACN